MIDDSKTGANASPAMSLSLPVIAPWNRGLSTQSLTTSSATAASATGCSVSPTGNAGDSA